jgi:peptide-methionine (R)-S-oxide reductase
MWTRRHFFSAGSAGIMLAWHAFTAKGAMAATSYAVTHTDEEWKKLLTPDQYAVLRQSATEAPFTSPLLHEERAGIFTCAGCDQHLYSSKTKFDSGTGWPSFWAPLDGGIDTAQDNSYGMARTAVSCHRCGGHLGHVFTDGPQPTGLRYCMNGVAMKFVAGPAA